MGLDFDFLTVIFHLAREADLLVGIDTSCINTGGLRQLLALQKNQHSIFDLSLVLPNIKENVLDLSNALDFFCDTQSIPSLIFNTTEIFCERASYLDFSEVHEEHTLLLCVKVHSILGRKARAFNPFIFPNNIRSFFTQTKHHRFDADFRDLDL
jgi:hypothetical protein